MNRTRPTSTKDLVSSERRMLCAIRTLGFGRFEYISIEQGEIVLSPWPTSVREVKFGTHDPGLARTPLAEFELKPQAAEFFEFVRTVAVGEIRTLEVKHGLPFSMEVEASGVRCDD